MDVKEEKGTIEQILYRPSEKMGGLIYLINKDPLKVSQMYDEIKAEKYIVAAYAIENNHCIVAYVNGRIKIEKK